MQLKLRKHERSTELYPEARGHPYFILILANLTDISTSDVSTSVKVDTDKLALKREELLPVTTWYKS